MNACCLSTIIGLALLAPSWCHGQSLAFGVKQSGLQSSYVGLPLGAVIPYVGFDLLRLSGSVSGEETDWSEYWQTGQLLKYSEQEWDYSGSATLLIPHVGVKTGLGGKEQVRPFLTADLFKSFAFVSVTGKDVYRQFNPDGTLDHTDTDAIRDEEKETAEDVLGFWGFTLGVGAEYFVSERFSVSGEYGIRFLFSSATMNGTDTENWDDDAREEWREEWESTLSGSYSASFAAIGLNFYF